MTRASLPLALAFATLMTATVAVSTAHAQTAHRPPTPAVVGTNHLVTLNREVFHYSSDGRRDPFVSLSTSSEIRPTLTDLRLTTVALDPTGRNSVAVLRDLGTKEQYRVKVGSELGRMRVIRIDQKTVTFAIEEFGFNRQATLAMGDSTRTTSTRNP
jgi:hypothetical protein